ncbi:hypothetical protein [Rubritalea tangerina]|uniref:hypothetical protein n=1 Tax=Rubritalea tangerina TaxID=430798 RepID=UPI003614D2E3
MLEGDNLMAYLSNRVLIRNGFFQRLYKFLDHYMKWAFILRRNILMSIPCIIF